MKRSIVALLKARTTIKQLMDIAITNLGSVVKIKGEHLTSRFDN